MPVFEEETTEELIQELHRRQREVDRSRTRFDSWIKYCHQEHGMTFRELGLLLEMAPSNVLKHARRGK